jgi:hypothetical protein
LKPEQPKQQLKPKPEQPEQQPKPEQPMKLVLLVGLWVWQQQHLLSWVLPIHTLLADLGWILKKSEQIIAG